MTLQAERRTVSVVGGGLAGLCAAISAAELGAAVDLHERTAHLGGRAQTHDPPYRANLGPHALYADGSTWAWLEERRLTPKTVIARTSAFRLRQGGRLRRLTGPMVWGAIRLRGRAPTDRTFGDWATERAGALAAETAAGVLSVGTYHHEPGDLSAAFALKRYRRLQNPRNVRYVVGGWSRLVEGLAERSRDLGVAIHLGSSISDLPDPPVVVATRLPAAARLLGQDLDWPGTRVALRDVAAGSVHRWPVAVVDLDRRVYMARYTAYDRTLAPDGQELIQCSTGMRPGEEDEEAQLRIRRALGDSFPGWDAQIAWQRESVLDRATGALDFPGTTSRDRPAIARGGGVFLAGDAVAAPGLLSEVAVASGIQAGRLAASWHASTRARERERLAGHDHRL
jgi:phytoene dehydrogenase-like protein